ncbi:hypothetical protein BESB_056600 [Besnoitia besnoiti]|uniref:CAAX protease self-immunity protein n=1 Tax=Besnoitia besnoiti TaxID=94643 RepID=A0A2A9MDQ3_BESBE|nr:hypothetical protein BESB_056600 [Besnoitia besnoiti]PFH36009.1 hypothetical protein BESB_056600 [Besnoitia besnoiti]
MAQGPCSLSPQHWGPSSIRPTAAPSIEGDAGPGTPSSPGGPDDPELHYSPLSPSRSCSRSRSWLTFLVPTASVALSVPVLLVVGFAPFFCMILFIVGLHNVLLAMIMMHWLCMLFIPLMYIYLFEHSFEYYKHVWKIQRCRFRHQWPWGLGFCLLAVVGLFSGYLFMKAVGGSWFAEVVEGARRNSLSEGLDLPFPLLAIGAFYFFVVNPVVEEWFWRVFLYREFGGAVFVSAPNGVLYMRETDPLLLSWCVQARRDSGTGATAVAVPLSPLAQDNTHPVRAPSFTLSPSRLRSAFEEAKASGVPNISAAVTGVIAATDVAQEGNADQGAAEQGDEEGRLPSAGSRAGAEAQEGPRASRQDNSSVSRVAPGGLEEESGKWNEVRLSVSDSVSTQSPTLIGMRSADAPGKELSSAAVAAQAPVAFDLERQMDDCRGGSPRRGGSAGEHGNLRQTPDMTDEEDPEKCPSPSAPVMTHVAPGVLQVDVRLSAAGQVMLSFFYASYHAVVFSTMVGLAYGFVALPCVTALGLLLIFFRNSSRFGILTGVLTHVGVDAAVVVILANVLRYY